MQKLSICIPHQYDRVEARRRTQQCVTQFREQYGGSLAQVLERWDGDTMDFTFVALGMPVTGQAQVEDRAVRLDIDLPWLLAGLAGGIKQALEQHGRKALGSPS